MWADRAIAELRAGQSPIIRPRGHSMRPRIISGARVTLEPIAGSLRVDDIVLVRCRGQVYLHRITAIEGDRFQIGNNRGHINGWVGRTAIYGRATTIEQP